MARKRTVKDRRTFALFCTGVTPSATGADTFANLDIVVSGIDQMVTMAGLYTSYKVNQVRIHVIPMRANAIYRGMVGVFQNSEGTVPYDDLVEAVERQLYVKPGKLVPFHKGFSFNCTFDEQGVWQSFRNVNNVLCEIHSFVAAHDLTAFTVSLIIAEINISFR